MKEQRNAEDLYLMVNGFRQSRILLTAVELDVFTALADSAMPSSQVAAQLGTAPRATDRLLNALCALGLLRKEDNLFSNADVAARYLVRGKQEYLSNLFHMNHLWDSWSDLTTIVRGGRGKADAQIRDRDDAWLEAFIAAMHHRGVPQAPPDINLIDLHDATRVLDLGGGSGAYAMAMVRVKQDLHATVFDLPAVVSLSERYIREAGLSHRIDTRAGDYHTDDLGEEYDVVFLSAILHSNAPDENAALIRKCADALNSGGQVVVQDFIMDEDRVRPEGGALFAINMLVATDAGDTYTASEVQGWMEEAGLAEIICRDAPSGTTQVVGRKGFS